MAADNTSNIGRWSLCLGEAVTPTTGAALVVEGRALTQRHLGFVVAT